MNWINKKAPTGIVEYNILTPTNKDVVATLTGLKEGVKILSAGGNTHTFKDNGKFDFIIEDDAGNRNTITAEVTWIDKVAPNVSVVYDVKEATSGSVVASLEGLEEGDVVVNNGGKATYTFNDNGKFEFIVQDAVGNENRVVAEVDWIDKTAPSGNLVYSINETTNKDVVVTLEGLKDTDTIVNNGGSNVYTFKDNGKFEFVVKNKAGTISKIVAEVTWIDKEAPVVDLEYDIKEATNKDVTVTVKGLKDDEKVVNNEGNTSYTFKDNGTFEFIIQDKAGNETKAIAEVNWIDKIAPTAEVEYSTEVVTNGSVVVSLKNFSEEGVEVVNNDGKLEYTFDNNGVFEFIIKDRAGNETKIPVAVNWIDKDCPVVDVSYSTKEYTNKSVVVSLEGLEEGDVVVNNEGKTSYTFENNGTFEFIVRDMAGNETKVPVAVNWIDKIAPTADIEYDIDSWTSGKVIAKLVNISEEVTVLNTENGAIEHTFNDNGEFIFEIQDRAGNVTKVIANVVWIDKTKPEEEVNYSIKDTSSEPVKVSLNINIDNIEVLNNNGSLEYVFTENGTFMFKLRMRSTGFEFELPVTVDWIDENSIKDNSSGNITDDEINEPSNDSNDANINKPGNNLDNSQSNKPNMDNSQGVVYDDIKEPNDIIGDNEHNSSENINNSKNEESIYNNSTDLSKQNSIAVNGQSNNITSTGNNIGQSSSGIVDEIAEKVENKENESKMDIYNKENNQNEKVYPDSADISVENEFKSKDNKGWIYIVVSTVGISLVALFLFFKKLFR